MENITAEILTGTAEVMSILPQHRGVYWVKDSIYYHVGDTFEYQKLDLDRDLIVEEAYRSYADGRWAPMMYRIVPKEWKQLFIPEDVKISLFDSLDRQVSKMTTIQQGFVREINLLGQKFAVECQTVSDIDKLQYVKIGTSYQNINGHLEPPFCAIPWNIDVLGRAQVIGEVRNLRIKIPAPGLEPGTSR